MNIDLHNMVDQLKAAAYTLTAYISEATYGSASYYVTVYVDAIGTQADHELRLNNVTLIIKGDLQLAGNINWHGIIIVTGVRLPQAAARTRKIFKGRSLPEAHRWEIERSAAIFMLAIIAAR